MPKLHFKLNFAIYMWFAILTFIGGAQNPPGYLTNSMKSFLDGLFMVIIFSFALVIPYENPQKSN